MPAQDPNTTKAFVSVTQLLANSEMTKAAVIDDAFDPLAEDELDVDGLRRLYQENAENPVFTSALQSLGIEQMREEDLEEGEPQLLTHLNQLWEDRDYSPEFRVLLRPLFGARLDKVADVERLCANLRILGVEVECIDSNVTEKRELFENGSFQFVFIDYFLGQENSDSIERAAGAIRNIHSWCGDKKPITVLMSSHENIDQQKENFRKKAGLMEGVFRFSGKSELSNEPILTLLMGALAKEFSDRHEFQFYTDALIKAAEDALEEFRQDVRSLKAEDYIFIQNLGLQKDEHPLGDYIAWLYGSYWGHLLLRNKGLQEQQRKLDSFFIADFPILHGQPSTVLADIYMSALFEEHEDVGIHPRQAQQSHKGEQDEAETTLKQSNNSLYLHLGDVFTDGENERVWMVISAQCDLERTVPGEQSIFLIPGVLKPLAEVVGKGETSIRTEFFRPKDQSQAFRIVWKPQEVQTRRFDAIPEWKSAGNLKRTHRLRLPYALEVQHAFTSNLSRIGLPVPPPLSQSVAIRVLHGKEGGNIQVILPQSSDYASRVMVRGDSNSIETRIVFTFPFARDLKKKLTELAISYGFDHMEEDEKRQHPLATLISNFDKWFFALASKPQKMPGAVKLEDCGTKVFMSKGWSNDVGIDWKRAAILIDVLEDEPA